MKDNKQNDTKIKRGCKFIGVVLLIVIITSSLIALGVSLISVGVGSDDGWLGYWGAIVGAVIAIGGVYWQASTSSDQQISLLKKQISQEKEMGFSQSRPFILIKQYKTRFEDISGNIHVSRETEKKIKEFNSPYVDSGAVNLLEINNISNKPMFAVKVVTIQSTGEEDYLNIERISEQSKSILLFDQYMTLINDRVTEVNRLFKENSGSLEDFNARVLDSMPCPHIKKLIIYFMTERREKIMLVFNCEDVSNEFILKYDKAESKLSNQMDGELDYDVSNFEGSIVINR